MTRESSNNKKQKIGKDLLITCRSGRQFMFRNVSDRTASLVEAHALSGQTMTVEISEIEAVEWVESEILNLGRIYPPETQNQMHEAHASKENSNE